MFINSSRNHVSGGLGADIPEGNQRLFYKNTLSKIAAVFVLLPKGRGARLPDLGRQVSEQSQEDLGVGPGWVGSRAQGPARFSPGSPRRPGVVARCPASTRSLVGAVTSDTRGLIFHPLGSLSSRWCITSWLRVLQSLTD